MKKEELKKLFQSEKFLSALNKVDSMGSLQRLLSVNGVEISIADMENIAKRKSNTELSESELMCVSAGVSFEWAKLAWVCFMACSTEE